MIIIKILLMIFLYLILFLLGLLLILLFSPIRGYAKFDINHIYFKGSYLFGLVKLVYEEKKVHVRLFGFKIKTNNSSAKEEDKDEASETDEEKSVKEKKSKDKKRSFKRPSKEIILLALDYIKKMIKKIAPRRAQLSLTLGLDDPYYTEMMHIISIFLFMPLNKVKHYNFSFTPVHDDIAIDYRGEALVSFSIMSLVIPTLRFILKKPIRRYLGIKLSFKKKTTE